jgi:hypothetical protein
MPTPFHSPIEKNLVWLVGFLEGDGCFGIDYQTCPYISVQVVDEPLLQFIAFLFETNVYTYNNPNQPKWRKVYRTRLNKREKLRWLLPRLYPYLSARRQCKVRELMHILDVSYSFDQTCSVFANKVLPNPFEKEKYSGEVPMLTSKEAQWLAGYFEAEGHMHLDKRASIAQPGLVFESTDQDVIAYVSTLFNKPYSQANRRTTANNLVFSVATKNHVSLDYLFPVLKVECHGSKGQRLQEGLDLLAAHRAWKRLPYSSRPKMWPKKPKK